MYLSDIFSSFICGEPSFDSQVRYLAKRSIVDTMGAMPAGSRTGVVRQLLPVYTAPGGCTLVGLPNTVSANNAAFLNGISGHELELDDTSSSNLGHPTVAVLPSVLAVGEERASSGQEVLKAFILATEVECKIGRICAAELHRRGWHASSITGVLGAAAGAGYLYGGERSEGRRYRQDRDRSEPERPARSGAGKSRGALSPPDGVGGGTGYPQSHGSLPLRKGAQPAMDNIKERTLQMHREHHSKLEVVPKVSICDTDSLSLAYTPGVAEPCREIARDPSDVYTYTSKGNMVAIVTDGTAVLGLGDIGPAAALPVMEGKACLFKTFGGAGAAGISICRLLLKAGVEDIILCDRSGAIYEGREGLNSAKASIAAVTNRGLCKGTLADAVKAYVKE